jgi:hypothetical protein
VLAAPRPQDRQDEQPLQVELENERLLVAGGKDGDRLVEHLRVGRRGLDVPLAGGNELQDLPHHPVGVVHVVHGAHGRSITSGDEVRQQVLPPLYAYAVTAPARATRVARRQQHHPIRSLVGLE